MQGSNTTTAAAVAAVMSTSSSTRAWVGLKRLYYVSCQFFFYSFDFGVAVRKGKQEQQSFSQRGRGGAVRKRPTPNRAWEAARDALDRRP